MIAEHTVKAFDEDITRLRGLITEMGGLAETALEGALDALRCGRLDPRLLSGGEEGEGEARKVGEN